MPKTGAKVPNEGQEIELAEAKSEVKEKPRLRSVIYKVGSWDMSITIKKKKKKRKKNVQCIICRLRGHIAKDCEFNLDNIPRFLEKN